MSASDTGDDELSGSNGSDLKVFISGGVVSPVSESQESVEGYIFLLFILLPLKRNGEKR